MEARTQKPTQQESTIVERVARIVSNVRGAKADYASLATELEPAIPFDIFGVVLLRHDREAVRVTVCQRLATTWVAHYHQHPIKDSRIEQLLNLASSPPDAASSTCEPAEAELSIRVTNYPEGLDGPPVRSGDALSGYHQLHSTLIAPLIIDGRLLGTLELGSIALNTYRDETLQRLIAGVAQVLAAAIEGAQVGGSVEIQDRQRQALKAVSSALTSRVDLATILHSIVNGIARSLNVASAIVMLDQREGGLSLASQSGMNPSTLSKIVSRKVMLSEQSIIGMTLRRRQPYVSQDIQTDERFPASRNLSLELGLHSIFCHPLATGTTVYGVLLLCSAESGGFTPLKADILSLFASQATIAIHNGMLLESAHQRSHFQETIEQLERAYQQGTVHSETSLQHEQELFKQVREASEQTFGVSLSSLMRFISDHLLTRNERNLHNALFQAAVEDGHEGEMSSDGSAFAGENRGERGIGALANVAFPVAEQRVQQWNETLEHALQSDEATPEKGIALLTRTAEEALARADVLSELSRLLTHLQQSTGHIQDAWFAIDLSGNCFSMNAAAETFCNIRVGTSATFSLQDIFAELLPRVRNSDEVSAYLQSFLAPDLQSNQATDCHCVLAIEPVRGRRRQKDARSEALLAGVFSDFRIEDVNEVDTFIPELEDISLQLNSAPSDHHYQMKRYPLLNRDGQLAAYALQIHDITEQVRDEKNKSALLSSVSHDLRTPLTTIKAAVTGLMQDDVLWEPQVRQEILREVDVETDHMTDLVDALVEMSRIEMGALSLEKEWCDVSEVVYGVLARLERVLANYTLKPIIQPQLPLIYGDHVQLGKVFYRLLENAAYHSPPGAEIIVQLAAIETRSSPELAPASMLEVRVIDQGSGVPEAEREHIFKSFYSLSPLGSGLGLAICKGIVEAHHGRIWVEPAAQGGSCFIITLPFSPYRSHLSEARSSHVSPASSPASIAQEASPEELR